MNALVGYRNNSLGNLTVTSKQRESAAMEITANYRAKSTALTQKSTATKATSESPVSQVANNELGRDAFLQLLVLELQNQDPLEPVDNSDMIAQLAQFSSLEGIENLNGNIELLAGNVDQLNFISAQGLIGKFVEGVNDKGEVTTGTVDSVYLDGSIVVLNVEGEIMSMSNVLSISNEAPEETSEATGDAESKQGNVIKRLGNSINGFLERF